MDPFDMGIHEFDIKRLLYFYFYLAKMDMIYGFFSFLLRLFLLPLLYYLLNDLFIGQ